MAREEEFEYESSSAPTTPRNSGDEKKKRSGLRKLISFTTKKSPNDLDKSERGMSKDDGGGSPSRSRRFNLFNRHRSQKDEGGAHPTKKDEPKPENNEKTQNLSEINKGLQENRPSNGALKEETKPSKHNLPAETIGEVLKLSEKAKEDSQSHPHKQTPAIHDDKDKSKEHQELKVVANEVEEKGVVKHDHKGGTKDEKPTPVTSKVVEEQSRELGSPPTDPPVLQEDGVGCESLAKGLQKVCLPWTINKEDH